MECPSCGYKNLEDSKFCEKCGGKLEVEEAQSQTPVEALETPPTKVDGHAIHIFVPPKDGFGENWVEQLLGKVVKPVYEKYHSNINWLWMTRYIGLYDENAPPCGVSLSQKYLIDGAYRHITFRVRAGGDVQGQIHEDVLQKAKKTGCYTDPSGWTPYSLVDDLGSNRFIKPDASFEERQQRAKLIMSFVYSSIRLMLDSLSENKGVWTLEPNHDKTQNPNGSFFESVHHLFCNTTNVPTSVLLEIEPDHLRLRTFWMPPYRIILDPSKKSELRHIRIQY